MNDELSIAEAAAFLDASEEAVMNLLRIRALPARFAQGLWLIPRPALKELKGEPDAQAS